MKGREKLTVAVGAAFALTAFVVFAASKADADKDVSSRVAETTVATNDNGSVSRTFVESTVTTNGSLVTEHRRETRTTLDAEGNMLATTTSEYAQSYPVGDVGFAPLASASARVAAKTDSFLGLAFGAEFKGTNLVQDSDAPAFLRATFKPKRALAGFDDYYVYVTPKTHRVAKVFACAKEAVDPGTGGRRHYLVEALEKKYATWARLCSWRRPCYALNVGDGRYVSICLEGASPDYETILAAADSSLEAQAAEELAALREEARKTAAERRAQRVTDAADAF